MRVAVLLIIPHRTVIVATQVVDSWGSLIVAFQVIISRRCMIEIERWYKILLTTDRPFNE